MEEEQLSPLERIKALSNGDENIEAELMSEYNDRGTVIGFEGDSSW